MMMILASVAVDHELLTRGRDHQPLRRSGSRESVRLIQCREYNRKVVDRTIEGVPPATFPLVFETVSVYENKREVDEGQSKSRERPRGRMRRALASMGGRTDSG